jgi:DnaJ-domain-containing protein 1
MYLKRYYDILGLPVNATDREIKNAYRKLAFRYHPDRNPEPDARAKFDRVKQAYEILNSPREKQPVNAGRHAKFNPSDVSKEERIKQAKNRHKIQILQSKIANERFYQSLVSGIRWEILHIIAKVAFVFGSLLLIEQTLPDHQVEDRIVNFDIHMYNGLKYRKINKVSTQKGDEIYLADLDYLFADRDPYITVQKSWIFHNSERVVSRDSRFKDHSYRVDWSTHVLYPWLSVLFFIPLFTIYYKRKTLTFTVLYYLSLYGIGIVTLVFIGSENRWAHLLTLGFL